jgi:hypothetical protein
MEARRVLALSSGTDLTVAVGGATIVQGTGDVTIESSRRATLRGGTEAVVESSGR